MSGNSGDEYYNARKDMNYYKRIIHVLHTIPMTSIIDIGARKSPMLESLPHTIDRVTLDRKWFPQPDGIRHITEDFYSWIPDKHYDVALCLQVLEHLDRPTPFARKLFDIADIVILSVPYRWKKGECKYHVQDPVTLEKVNTWTGRKSSAHLIVRDNQKDRLICLYDARSKVVNH